MKIIYTVASLESGSGGAGAVCATVGDCDEADRA